MYALGIDIGASSMELALLQDGVLQATWDGPCHGGIAQGLRAGLQQLPIPADTRVRVCAVDSGADVLLGVMPGLQTIGTVPAIVEGVRHLVPEAGSIVEIGSQSARFITGVQGKVPAFSANEHCAGGTGSFFEDQMTRLGMKIEDFSALTEQAQSVPRISGRCAVFAKSDIVHRQQEGTTTPDILLGLCYAMIRNYRATVVRNLPVEKPLVFCGGVTRNAGVLRAIREVFELAEDELIIPQEALYVGALGAALAAQAEGGSELTLRALDIALQAAGSCSLQQGLSLPALELPEDVRGMLHDPEPTGIIPAGGCWLGIDIGSTSTDLVLTGPDGELVDFQYLRTAGDGERAVRQGFASIRSRFGEVPIRGVAVTGSGRERIGRMIGADITRDEITCQARGAAACVPEADTVFEIGGQDSKYMQLRDGRVTDFQMNRICAAGTGSFVEEQAARMGIPLATFGELALQAGAPAALGERCTVFIETAINTAAARGASQADLCAGLCHSIVRNYLHRVVGSKPVGQHIVLQGGVAYNPGIVAAFRSAYGERVQVNPYFSISGAYGAALLAQEAVGEKQSTFRGYDFAGTETVASVTDAEIRKNIAFFEQAGKLLLDGYTGEIDPKKKTVGIPFCLMIHHFFPMAQAYFKSLGYNVLLSDPSNEDTVRLCQLHAQGETCYPVKLIYGHMQQLVEKKVDYIFLPRIHTMKHVSSGVEHNYGCVYMQTAAQTVARALRIEEKGIKLLSPEFDLDMGQQMMAMSMVGMGSKQLGKPKPFCMKALASGAMAVKRYNAAVEKQGEQLLASIRPEDKVLVLITRNYGINDPILNMGIPQLLLERGCKVITLDHLPGHSLKISDEYPNVFWPFGQHIVSGAKLVAHHPNLYAVYLTNHGCGPDSMIAHLFRQEMGDKPYLQIEVDEHFSPVGVITRIEAFLNSLESRPAVQVPADFQLMDVTIRPGLLKKAAEETAPLYLPALGAYTPFLERYYREAGFDARTLPPITDAALSLGRAETGAKEYLPFAALLGSCLQQLAQADSQEAVQFLIPQSQGAEADGVYAQVIAQVLHRKGYAGAQVVAPMLETVPADTGAGLDALLRAVLAGDLVNAAPAEGREAMAEALGQGVPSWQALQAAAESIGQMPVQGRRLALVGTPLCLTDLSEGIPEMLEAGGDTVLRAPLAEYLLHLWKDSGQDAAALQPYFTRIGQLHRALGAHSAFDPDQEALMQPADAVLPRFAGANGRYRYAKTCRMGAGCDAVILLEPRYENTSMVLDMSGLQAACPAPLLRMALDHDLDDAALSGLRSFLYYC